MSDLSPQYQQDESDRGHLLKQIIRLEAEIARLTEENKELKDLFNLQHTRTAKADKLWQKAFNEPNTLPDLGQLIDWMLSENSRLRDALDKISTSAPCVDGHESYNTPGQICDQRIATEALASPPKEEKL